MRKKYFSLTNEKLLSGNKFNTKVLYMILTNATLIT